MNTLGALVNNIRFTYVWDSAVYYNDQHKQSLINSEYVSALS